MTVQTILAVGAWVFSMVAVSIAICARTKANDNSDWFQHRIDRITEKFCAVEKLRSYDKGEFRSLSKRVDDLENQLSEEEDCEPRRPRSCVGVVGDNVCVYTKHECEVLKAKLKATQKVCDWHRDKLKEACEMLSRLVEKGE